MENYFEEFEEREHNKRMTVVACYPGKTAQVIEIEGSLESMQKFVGGSIQAVYPFNDPVAIICNDEGKLQNLPMNRYIPEIRDVIAGTFFLCGAPPEGENFASLTEEQLQRYTQRFYEPEQFCQLGKNLLVLRSDPETGDPII